MTVSNTFNPQESPVCLSLIACIFACSVLALRNKRLFFAGLLHPVTVSRKKEYYRLVTSDLIHNDLVHLFVNVFALFAVGSQLEEYLRSINSQGSLLFVFVYLCSCVSGTFFTFLMHRKDFEFSSAGASGSVLGCMMSFMILQPYHIAFYIPVVGGVINMYTALIYIVFLIVYQLRTANPLVNNEVHFYGALGGIISALIIKG
ncbi:rhomboid family intramembrane serine protease [Mucilaginibacter rigui]|uniref:Rhomboid family intramembrane serine protease n=1 Tax=Mucilaginibacter rigui TaxID=534635 RepID=A0ABR7X5M7_9SPHI|nr:rhomboid family intramembrane serine protease [Mucilaginibacter rigui]MBD1385881.1 rhomboid family intramembrane serine protease [Mucilaginibacter rigui]